MTAFCKKHLKRFKSTAYVAIRRASTGDIELRRVWRMCMSCEYVIHKAWGRVPNPAPNTHTRSLNEYESSVRNMLASVLNEEFTKIGL